MSFKGTQQIPYITVYKKKPEIIDKFESIAYDALNKNYNKPFCLSEPDGTEIEVEVDSNEKITHVIYNSKLCEGYIVARDARFENGQITELECVVKKTPEDTQPILFKRLFEKQEDGTWKVSTNYFF